MITIDVLEYSVELFLLLLHVLDLPHEVSNLLAYVLSLRALLPAIAHLLDYLEEIDGIPFVFIFILLYSLLVISEDLPGLAGSE